MPLSLKTDVLWHGLLACHVALIVTAAALCMSTGTGVALSTGLATASALPLVLAVPGIRAARRYTLQWLSLLIVVYIGLTAVEVIASAAEALPSITLGLGGLELALLLRLLRRPDRSTPGGSTE